jgi:hypothetical protein
VCVCVCVRACVCVCVRVCMCDTGCSRYVCVWMRAMHARARARARARVHVHVLVSACILLLCAAAYAVRGAVGGRIWVRGVTFIATFTPVAS